MIYKYTCIPLFSFLCVPLFFTFLENKKISMTLASYNVWYSSRKHGPWVVFIKLPSPCNFFIYYYQQCIELPCMNMFEYTYCLLNIFPTNVFLDIRIETSPDVSSLHDFEVSITLVRPKYQSQPTPFKLVILTIDGVFCSCPWPRARGGHSIVKLKTTCEQKKSTFSKLHQQNGSNFYQKKKWVHIHGIYYIVNIENQIW